MSEVHAQPPWKLALIVGASFAALHAVLLAIAFQTHGETAFGWIVLALSSPGYDLLRALRLDQPSILILPLIVLLSGCAGAVLGYVIGVTRRRWRRTRNSHQ